MTSVTWRAWRPFAATGGTAPIAAAVLRLGVDPRRARVATVELGPGDGSRVVSFRLAEWTGEVLIVADDGFVAWLRGAPAGKRTRTIRVEVTVEARRFFIIPLSGGRRPTSIGTPSHTVEYRSTRWQTVPIRTAPRLPRIPPIRLDPPTRRPPGGVTSRRLPSSGARRRAEPPPYNRAPMNRGRSRAAPRPAADPGDAGLSDVRVEPAETTPEAPATATATVTLTPTVVVGEATSFSVTLAGTRRKTPKKDHQDSAVFAGVIGEFITVEAFGENAIVTLERGVARFPSAVDTTEVTGTITAVRAGPVTLRISFARGHLLLATLAVDAMAVAPGSVDRPGPADPSRNPATLDERNYPQERRIEISEATLSAERTRLLFRVVENGRPQDWSREVELAAIAASVEKPEELWQRRLAAAKAATPPDEDPRPVATAAFMADLRSAGARLRDALLPDEFRDHLVAHEATLGDTAFLTTGTRIPWELIHLDVPGVPEGRFLAELGLVRWLRETTPHRDLRVDVSRARWLIPKYRTNPLSYLDAERDYLKTMLGAARLAPSSVTGLGKLVRRRDFDLLHFAGHGEIDETVQRIRPANDFAQTYPADAVAEQFHPPQPPQKNGRGPIVVLNACQSGDLLDGSRGFATAFLHGGAEVFVGCQWSVGDGSAARFAQQFYDALTVPGTRIAEACRIARSEAKKGGDATWLAYTVYADPLATVEFVGLPPRQ